MDGFAACFEGLDDPRTGNAGRHDLLEMLMIALCTVLSGGEDCTDMAEFARVKLGFLRGFLKLEHGAPSHDTFSRLFRLLDAEQFRGCFQQFMTRFAETCQGVVAIDGKVLRRSFDKASGKSALHMVSAWGCEQRLVLGQVATDAKSNEITAVPKLLKMLRLEGCIVTVDALNCQREIARQIIDQKADYALALKGNQGTLHDDVRTFLDDPETELSVSDSTVDGDHGRIETRTSMVSTDISWLRSTSRCCIWWRRRRGRMRRFCGGCASGCWPRSSARSRSRPGSSTTQDIRRRAIIRWVWRGNIVARWASGRIARPR